MVHENRIHFIRLGLEIAIEIFSPEVVDLNTAMESTGYMILVFHGTSLARQLVWEVKIL